MKIINQLYNCGRSLGLMGRKGEVEISSVARTVHAIPTNMRMGVKSVMYGKCNAAKRRTLYEAEHSD